MMVPDPDSPFPPVKRRQWLLPPACLLLTLLPCVAFAEDAPVNEQTVWTSWDPSPDVVVPTLLVLGVYIAGLVRRPDVQRARPWRTLSFFAGVFLTVMSLISPLDAFADHLFAMHQVQHMLLRVVGPMLIALSQPQALLIAGLPQWAKRWIVGPVTSARPVQAVFGFLTQPAIDLTLFIASLYLWQWPPLHNRAIVDEGVHYVMHVTMLAAGLLFFWRVLDHRPTPKGTPYGVRLMMVWIAALANIPIGAYTAFKSQVLYPAYDVAGRLYHMAPIADERLGGFIMWAPSTMMLLLAVLVIIHSWGVQEEKAEIRKAAGLPRVIVTPPPEVQAQMVRRQRPRNRALALALGAFVGCILVVTVTIGFIAASGVMSSRRVAQSDFGDLAAAPHAGSARP